MLPLIPIAGALGLFYLATRSPARQVGPPPPANGPGSAPPQNGPSSPSSGPLQQGTTVPDVGGNALAAGQPDTVEDSQGNTAPNDFMANNGGFADEADFRATFIAQVYAPAANVRLQDLTAEDIQDAFTFLSGGGGNAGKWVRRDDLGTRFKAAVAGIESQQTGQLTAQIVGDIESIIPVVGSAISSVTNSAIPALQNSIQSETGDLTNIVQNAVSPATLATSPGARAIMRPSFYIGTYKFPGTGYENVTIDVATTPNYSLLNGATYLNYPIDGETPLTRDELLTSVALDGLASYNGFSWEGDHRVHSHLLTRTPYGWLFPWLCNWFDGLSNNNQGSGQTIVPLAERINRRARLYRAIDLIICKAFPLKPNYGSYDVYFYASKKWGPVLGSIFPPSAVSDEGRYIDLTGIYGPKGQNYAYDGKPIASIVQQAAGPGGVATPVIAPPSTPPVKPSAATVPTTVATTVAPSPTFSVPPGAIEGAVQNPPPLTGPAAVAAVGIGTVALPPGMTPPSSGGSVGSGIISQVLGGGTIRRQRGAM